MFTAVAFEILKLTHKQNSIKPYGLWSMQYWTTRQLLKYHF